MRKRLGRLDQEVSGPRKYASLCDGRVAVRGGSDAEADCADSRVLAFCTAISPTISEARDPGILDRRQ